MSQITEYLCSQPQFSSEGLIRLFLNQCPAGWIEKDIAAELLNFSNEWTNHNGSIYIGNDNLTAQLQRAAYHLQEQGLILGWRNEKYGVCVEDNTGAVDFDRPVCALERATFRRFGFVSRAIHVNAYYPDGTICLGKRAHTKSIDPNKLDNMAAGGIPIYESFYDCAIRELAEEAGVPNDIAKKIQLIESIHIQRNEIDGTHNEILYCFDLALPEYFTPQNQDGEVAGFYRKSPNEVITLLPEMTWDAGRVMAEFLIRRGWK